MQTYPGEETIQAPERTDGRRRLLLYLAGPITGLGYSDALDWREDVRTRLASSAPHVECIDPMRAKQHLADLQSIGPHGHAGGLLNSHAVVARDMWDVDRSDVILLNLTGARQISIGSMVELGRASARGKFVIVVLPPEETGEAPDAERNPHDHLFVFELASTVAPSVDEALVVIESI
jgi:nucleoside 2-deoxyribosyltransferase